MKRKLSYLISAFLITGSLVFAPTIVAAHGADDTTTSGSTSNSTSASDTTDDSTKTAQVEKETHDIKERIAKFKANFKVKLTAFQAAALKQKCVGAQGFVGKLHTKFGNSVTVRTQAYDSLTKNLDKLVTKLKAKNIDTATLETQIKELNTLISTYNTDLTAYKQSLSDLKDVDCKTDPDGFQAALLAARTAHDTLVKDVVAIRHYLISTIKPTLQSIKMQLDGGQSDTSTVEDNSKNTSGGSQ